MKLTDQVFHDADKARAFMEAQRWPNGPVCPHCGNVDQAKIKHLEGKAHRPGVYECYECRDQFTVTVGTVYERSKIPLHKWLMAIFMLNAGKKGTSAHQLHRQLGVTYKTAWFMAHRIRESMRQEGLDPLGGGGKIVEADETYYGDIPEAKRRRVTTSGRPFTKRGKTGPANKRAILSLVERGGRVRSFHVPAADKATVDAIVKENIERESRLHTDESKLYGEAADHFAGHETVTRFDLEETAVVPWEPPLCDCWNGYDSPILGELPVKQQIECAYKLAAIQNKAPKVAR